MGSSTLPEVTLWDYFLVARHQDTITDQRQTEVTAQGQHPISTHKVFPNRKRNELNSRLIIGSFTRLVNDQFTADENSI